MLSDAAVKCVSASVCTVPETLHALCTILLQENTPVLGKLFRPPWLLPESIRLCDNQTPDTRQLASGDHQEIETLLGQFRLDLSSSSFQDDSDTKRAGFARPGIAPLREEEHGNSTTIDAPGSTMVSHIRVSCASKKTRPNTSVDCHVLCTVCPHHRNPMALCTDDLPIRARKLQDLNGTEKHGCGAAHILLKLRWTKKTCRFRNTRHLK